MTEMELHAYIFTTKWVKVLRFIRIQVLVMLTHLEKHLLQTFTHESSICSSHY